MVVPAVRVDELVGDRPVFDYDRQTERPLLRRLDDLLPADGVFWDVGAHAGLYAVVAAGVCPALDVRCFEASPVTREERLHDAVGPLENVTVVPVALDERPGRPIFCESGTGDTNNALAAAPVEPDDHERVTVRAHSARSAVDDLGVPAPDAVKIDVEGAEARVLRGFDADLLAGVDVVLVELHHVGRTDMETTDLLADHGFDCETWSERDHGEGRRTEHVVATRGRDAGGG